MIWSMVGMVLWEHRWVVFYLSEMGTGRGEVQVLACACYFRIYQLAHPHRAGMHTWYGRLIVAFVKASECKVKAKKSQNSTRLHLVTTSNEHIIHVRSSSTFVREAQVQARAPCFRNNCTSPWFAPNFAARNGVKPKSPRALTLAPRSISNSTISEYPLRDASINGVQ